MLLLPGAFNFISAVMAKTFATTVLNLLLGRSVNVLNDSKMVLMVGVYLDFHYT